MKKIRKTLFVIFRNIIKPIQYFDTNLYMKLYIWYLKQIGVNLCGTPRYIHPSVQFDGTGYEMTYLGEDIVISKNTVFLNHDYSLGCGLRALGEKHEKTPRFLREIHIGNNCFIGANCVILPGVRIGDNCIIGAGSVVRGRWDDNCVISGNPASVISKTTEWAKKYR